MAFASRRCPKVPKFLLLIFFILSILKSSISLFLQKLLGLSVFITQTSNNSSDVSQLVPYQYHRTQIPEPEFSAVSTDIIRKLLPIVKFKDIVSDVVVDGCTRESCAVCLCEFEGEDEIRLLMDCRHIFHKSCLDDWIDYDHRTCPLCRTPFISIELEKMKRYVHSDDSRIN